MQFQSELELKVKVIDDQLDELEKRMKRVANPFQASGARKRGYQSKRELAVQQTLLNVDKNRLKLAADLNTLRIKNVNLNTSWYKALQQGKQIQLDINKAVAKEAQLRAETQKNARSNRLESVALGVGFPLLFGGGAGSVAGGALGSFVGDKGFGGQILLSAVGQVIDNFTQRLGELAKSIDSTDDILSELETAGYTVSDSTKTVIDAYQRVGREADAYKVALEEINRVLGPDGASKLSDYRIANEELSAEFEKAKAALDAELLPVLTGTIRLILALKGAFDEIAESKLFKIISGASNLAGQLLPGIGEGMRAFGALGDLGAPSGKVITKNNEQNKLRVEYRKQEIALLDKELAIKQMTRKEDAYAKASAEAGLKVARKRLALAKAENALKNSNLEGKATAEEAVNKASDALKRAEAEQALAKAAQEVYEKYTQQAKALQQVVHQGKLRLRAEQAVAAGRSKLTGAFYDAELKVNELAIQRAKQRGDTNQVLQLELRQVELIYQKTVAQVQAEVERAALKVRQVALEVKLLEVENLKKQAKGDLVDADRQALELQKQALQIAQYNLRVQGQVAQQQIRGAAAVRTASQESLKFNAKNGGGSGSGSGGGGGAAQQTASLVVAGTSAVFENLTKRLAEIGVRGFVTAEQGERILSQHLRAADKQAAAARQQKVAADKQARIASGAGRRPGLGTSNLAVNAIVKAVPWRRTSRRLRICNATRRLQPSIEYAQTEILRRIGIEGKQASQHL